MKLKTIASLALILALSMVLLVAPEERSQGLVQKIFYIHVTSAMLMYLGFFIAFVGGIFYLIDRKLAADEWQVAGAEVGFVFATMVLLTGPFWARPIWGAWWTWDPRLTTTFLLWLIYSGYHIVRRVITDSHHVRTASAVIAVLAFLDVPLIHYSVKIWRGIHPSVLTSSDGVPMTMRLILYGVMLAQLVWFAALFHSRWTLERMRNRTRALEDAMEREDR